MKNFEEPIYKILKFEILDVITASWEDGEDLGEWDEF